MMRNFMPLISASDCRSLDEKIARMPVMPQPRPIVPVSLGSTSKSFTTSGWRTSFATAIVSGRVWQGLPAADKEIITRMVKETLDAQIDSLAGDEPNLIENFKKAPIPIRQVAVADTEAVIAEFDKIWMPKAPVIASLRKLGASI